MDKISIIIPFYNAEQYINNCVESLLKQTYKNFEAIFVNDGSNDMSLELLKKIKDSRIKIINIKRSGVSVARNIGLTKMNGSFIAFLDVDDEYKENYLEKMLYYIKKNKADIVLCDYIERYNHYDIQIKLPWKNEIIDKNKIANILIPCMIAKNGINDKNPSIRALVWRTFIRTEYYNKINTKFDSNVSMAEDLLFLIELYINSNKIFILSEPLYIYNKYNNSTMNRYKNNCINSQVYFHNMFIKLLNKYDLLEINKSRYANNRLIMYKSLLANAIKNNKGKSAILSEIYSIIDFYKKDNYIKYLDCKLGIIDELTLKLLKLSNPYILYKTYYIKEKYKNKKLLKERSNFSK